MIKELTIKEILEKQNSEVKTDSFLVKNTSRALTSKGNPYLTITLQDLSGTTVSKFWNPTENDLADIKAGVFILAQYSVGSYNEQPQLNIVKILQIATIDNDDIDIGKYTLATEYDISFLKKEIKTAISNLKNPNIKAITLGVFKDAGIKFFEHPAATSVHHDFAGGLAQHTYEMVQLGYKVCEVFPDLNQDLIIAGALLHDAAKTVELSGALGCEYTSIGKLLGHITMCQAYVYNIAKTMGLHHTNECLYLQHMVISHHGELEYGSPVRPMFREAMILNQIDGISAKYNTMTKAISETEENGWSSRIPALGREVLNVKL